ncbi:MAG TPA: nucleotidyltransferase family protein [Armatimonadota bacterium]|nr:nucleotidyltransferase family protein [Armatimonadota bacterium]
MPARIPIDRERIAEFCRKWQITEFALFGSVLRDDFRPDSDVDVLVSFAPGAHTTLLDLAEMEEELRDVFGRDVDVVSRRGIERSENFMRRKDILSSAEVVHAA